MPAPRIRIVGSDDIAMAVSSGSGSGLSCWRFLFFLFCSMYSSLVGWRPFLDGWICSVSPEV